MRRLPQVARVDDPTRPEPRRVRRPGAGRAVDRHAPRAVTTLEFDRAGSGPRVLLVHGLGGERHVWEPVWPALTARCDVLRIDLPGFGGSDPLPAGSDVSPQGLARAVAAFLAEAGFDHPHVAGNSLGGWVALELARLGLARSVTALCPARASGSARRVRWTRLRAAR